MSLEAYREHVEKLARKREGDPIFNGSTEHASIIVERMFAHAHKSVCVLSGKLNARVYGPEEVLAEAELFLADSTHSLRILVEQFDEMVWEKHPFFKKFAAHKNVAVRCVPPEHQQDYEFHFLLMDDDSYRFESDKSTHVAIAAFGDKQGAANLSGIFNKLWERSDSILAPKTDPVA